MAVRVKGFASPEAAALALGVALGEAQERLEKLAANDLVKATRLGSSLTPSGAEALEGLLAEEGLRDDADLRDCYTARFVDVDRRVKKLTTEWQHSPDHRVVDALIANHDKASSCLKKIGARAERYVPYKARLDACVSRLHEGDDTAFMSRSGENYHQVWWELHTDLLTTLGLERED